MNCGKYDENYSCIVFGDSEKIRGREKEQTCDKITWDTCYKMFIST